MKSLLTVVILLTALCTGEELDDDPYATLYDKVTEWSKDPEIQAAWDEHIEKFNIGGARGYQKFQCDVERSPTKPTSVHELRPGDIDVVAALGDSITASNGGKAATIVGLIGEYRGMSWSIGGDNTLDEDVTIPNILKKFNPNLKGYSRGISGTGSYGAKLNMARPGGKTRDMTQQARKLVQLMKLGMDGVDFQNDWKLVTLFIGGNDHCGYCNNKEAYSADRFVRNVMEALDYMQQNMPRTFVNLNSAIDVTLTQDVDAGLICKIMLFALCDCGAYSQGDLLQELKDVYRQYNQKLRELIESGRYDTKDDFTVVYQPYMDDAGLPLNPDGTPDMEFLAPDCFHFGSKGHEMCALSLWNNMLQPVGKKSKSVLVPELMICPTKEHPYLFTALNSQNDSRQQKLK